MIIVGVPALELGVLSVLQNVLLALEVWVVEADEGPALHPDRVHPVHEAPVLEVVTVAADLQFPPGETFSLIEHDLSSSEDSNTFVPNKCLYRKCCERWEVFRSTLETDICW